MINGKYRQLIPNNETILRDTAALNHTVKNLLDKFGNDLKFLWDPTRGGVPSLLNEIAELTHLRFEINQKDIPVDEQVKDAREMLGVDPLYVANERIFWQL